MKALKKLMTFTIAFALVITSYINNGFLMNVIEAEALSVIGRYAVISNESTNENSYGSTGTFSIENLNYEVDENFSPDTYKMDAVKSLNVNIALNIEQYAVEPEIQSMLFEYQEGDTKNFWTYNFQSDYYTQVTATLKSSGAHSNVWVKLSDYNMSATDADRISAEFDSNIYPDISTVFGLPSDTDGNSKVDILCFNIIDGLVGGYIAGYFDPNDLFENNVFNPYSNEMEVFYIDTDPAMGSPKDVTRCYGTVAHEFQHMVNFNQNYFIENSDEMDIWLNEALSEAASQVYTGQISQSRINYYNSSTKITEGHSLLRWTNELENYSLSYLFAEYLKEQAGIGDSVFTEVMLSTYNDYRAVEEVIQNHINPGLTFGEFMTNFRAALLLKKPTGAYGFKGVAGYNTINQKIYTGAKRNLYGGGAVVIESDNGEIEIPADKGATVRYLIICDPPVITGVVNNGLYNTDRTITFNNGTATIDGNPFTSGQTIASEGQHSLVVTIDPENITTVNFEIDKTAPVVSGVENNGMYNVAKTVTFSDGTATLNGSPFTSGSTINTANNFVLIVTDLADNSIIINFIVTHLINDWVLSGDIIKGLNVATTLNSFLNGIDLSAETEIAVLNAGGFPVTSPDALIGTGMTVNVYFNEILINSYTTMLRGDVSGDGHINGTDTYKINRYIAGFISMQGVYLTAADVTRDGFINGNDTYKINRYLIGSATIDQIS